MKSQVDLFDEMLTLTTELFYPIEQELFLSAVDIGNKKVLDVGCGNGAYMNRFHENFPTARLTGVEYEKGIYQRASLRANEKMTFHHMSYEELPVVEPFDLVILRLVIHHLPDKQHFCSWLREVTHAESIIVVIEVDNEQLNNNGQLPLFSSLYLQSRAELHKNRFLDVKDALRIELEHYGLFHKQTTTYSIDSSASDNKSKLYSYMQLVAQTRLTDPLPPDLSNELAAWFHDPLGTHKVYMFGMLYKLSKFIE